eukprot:10357258-Ditylum_brightwellii.AAC.1
MCSAGSLVFFLAFVTSEQSTRKTKADVSDTMLIFVIIDAPLIDVIHNIEHNKYTARRLAGTDLPLTAYR